MAVSQQSATKAQEVRALLDQAHAFIAQGSVMEAFEVVIQAVTVLDGPHAVLPLLERARQNHHRSGARVPAPPSMEDLVGLFAQVTVSAQRALGGGGATSGSPAGPSTDGVAAGAPWNHHIQHCQRHDVAGITPLPAAGSGLQRSTSNAAAASSTSIMMDTSGDYDAAAAAATAAQASSSTFDMPMQQQQQQQQQYRQLVFNWPSGGSGHPPQPPPPPQQQQHSYFSAACHDGHRPVPSSQLTGALARGTPILQETDREGITDCALQDGSSYVCSQCGGVVPHTRRQQHDQFWCDGP